MQMKHMPPWFMSLALCEVCVQLPFFFVGTYAFITGKQWIRLPALIYGVSTATTLIPILADIMGQPNRHRNVLLAFYLPYLIVPAAIAVVMTRQLHRQRLPLKLA